MKYIKVYWHHAFPEEPIVLYSELDDSNWECRKVYTFREGPPGFANASESTRSVALSTEPLPSVSEITSDPQFTLLEIPKEEFEEIWSKAHSQMP